jgi:hypothetical protein
MKILEKTRVGILVDSEGKRIATVRTGEPLFVGRLTGHVILNRYDSLKILFWTPIEGNDIQVSVAGRRQAGAFLLNPGQSVNLWQDHVLQNFRFDALPVFPVETETGEVCEFCRTVLVEGRGNFCLSCRLPDQKTGVLLCDGCANTWADEAGCSQESSIEEH